MQFAEPEILELTQGIWNSVLEMDIEAGEPACTPADSLAAEVRISGGWEGSVRLQGSLGFSRRAASVMFAKCNDDVTLADMQDAIAELANMVGGNLKSILPGPSKLSLPKAVEAGIGGHDSAEDRRLTDVALCCDNEPVHVTVYH